MRPQGQSIKILTDELDKRFHLTIEEFGTAYNHRYAVVLNCGNLFETDDLGEAERRYRKAVSAYKSFWLKVVRNLQEVKG